MLSEMSQKDFVSLSNLSICHYIVQLQNYNSSYSLSCQRSKINKVIPCYIKKLSYVCLFLWILFSFNLCEEVILLSMPSFLQIVLSGPNNYEEMKFLSTFFFCSPSYFIVLFNEYPTMISKLDFLQMHLEVSSILSLTDHLQLLSSCEQIHEGSEMM